MTSAPPRTACVPVACLLGAGRADPHHRRGGPRGSKCDGGGGLGAPLRPHAAAHGWVGQAAAVRPGGEGKREGGGRGHGEEWGLGGFWRQCYRQCMFGEELGDDGTHHVAMLRVLFCLPAWSGVHACPICLSCLMPPPPPPLGAGLRSKPETSPAAFPGGFARSSAAPPTAHHPPAKHAHTRQASASCRCTTARPGFGRPPPPPSLPAWSPLANTSWHPQRHTMCRGDCACAGQHVASAVRGRPATARPPPPTPPLGPSPPAWVPSGTTTHATHVCRTPGPSRVQGSTLSAPWRTCCWAPTRPAGSCTPATPGRASWTASPLTSPCRPSPQSRWGLGFRGWGFRVQGGGGPMEGRSGGRRP